MDELFQIVKPGDKITSGEAIGSTMAAGLVPSTPPPLPQPNDAAVRKIKKRSIAAMRARRGRASTILTDDTAISDALGG